MSVVYYVKAAGRNGGALSTFASSRSRALTIARDFLAAGLSEISITDRRGITSSIDDFALATVRGRETQRGTAAPDEAR